MLSWLCTSYYYLLVKKNLDLYWKNLVQFASGKDDPAEKALHDIYNKEICLSPIPSLSIHCANINSIYGISPNINWLQLWEKNNLENDKSYPSGSTVSQFNILDGQISGYKPADFDYEFNVEVTKFIISVGTNQALTINGNFIEGLAEDYVRQAPAGTPIIFSSIEAIGWEGNDKSEAFAYKVNDFTLKKQ